MTRFKLPAECARFRSRLWKALAPLTGTTAIDPLDDVPVTKLMEHLENCPIDCRDHASRFLGSFWDMLASELDIYLRAFMKEEKMISSQLIPMIEHYLSPRNEVLRRSPIGKRLERTLNEFMTVLQIPEEDVRTMLETWVVLSKRKPQ